MEGSGLGEQAFSLPVLFPTSHLQSALANLISGPSLQLCATTTLGGSSVGSSNCVSATHMGDLGGVPSPGCYGHLGSESVDGYALYVCMYACMCMCFSNKK